MCMRVRLAGSSISGEVVSSSVLATLNVAVFAPMPNARVSTAIAVKPGLRASMRKP